MATKKKIIDYNEIFYDKNNGLPDEITKAGCIALAKLGKDAWNSWSKNHPVRYEDTNQGTIAKNTVDFSDFDFSKYFEESESKTIIHIDFKGFDFRERANFSNAIFCIRTDFSNSTFGEGTNFTGAVFKENVYFNDTNFGLNSRFIGCKFYGKSRFIGARFDRNSSFRNSSFSKNASFIGAQFGNSADFRDTIFFSFTNFSGGQFGTDIKFDDSIFKGSANFTASDWPLILPYYKDIEDAKNWSCEHGATPDNFRDISFNGVEFLNHVNFSDRIFIGKTSFSYLTNDNVLDKPCVFRKAPLFFNCKLNQNISFYGAIFPESTSGKKMMILQFVPIEPLNLPFLNNKLYVKSKCSFVSNCLKKSFEHYQNKNYYFIYTERLVITALASRGRYY
ncbi:pentapeptide repeat-containing protein [Methylomonas sp. EFPC3]|uniref:pentapeptide repeat-containing protein n=1 Tax=Methylomonas sp. EFPC3 TaxID=3021710 RepID=UPI002417EF40|nr:pentapeptide repeat-containing protein [Methylomonas sp. EFPC3]WFP51879.1 pentapeptide repeat-containing protein [Methylomonas sp. EFPC3]